MAPSPSPRNLAAPKPQNFSAISQLEHEYLRNATRHHNQKTALQTTGGLNLVHFGPQTVKNRTGVLAHPTGDHQAGQCHASSLYFPAGFWKLKSSTSLLGANLTDQTPFPDCRYQVGMVLRKIPGKLLAPLCLLSPSSIMARWCEGSPNSKHRVFQVQASRVTASTKYKSTKCGSRRPKGANRLHRDSYTCRRCETTHSDVDYLPPVASTKLWCLVTRDKGVRETCPGILSSTILTGNRTSAKANASPTTYTVPPHHPTKQDGQNLTL